MAQRISDIEKDPLTATVIVIGLILGLALTDWAIRDKKSTDKPIQGIFDSQPEPIWEGLHNPLLVELRRLNPHSNHSVTDWDGGF